MQPTSQLIEIIAILLAFFFAITFHEFSHALAAYLLGDDTAKRAGRLTLNPLKHIDLLGLLCLFLFRIGWAKPVPMNMYNFKYPRFYALLSALAGPVSNFVVALFALYCIKYIPFTIIESRAALFLSSFLKTSVQLNVMLGVFNLLPIPPLDGGHIIDIFIPAHLRERYYRLLPFSILLLLLILMLKPTQQFLIWAINSTIAWLQHLVI
jgi:Zn-dependent protease